MSENVLRKIGQTLSAMNGAAAAPKLSKITLTCDDGEREISFSPPIPADEIDLSEAIASVMCWPPGYGSLYQNAPPAEQAEVAAASRFDHPDGQPNVTFIRFGPAEIEDEAG